MLEINYGLVGILVFKFVILEACMYGQSLCDEVRAWFTFDCLPYEWRSGTSDGLFLPIYPPRSMRISTLLRWLIMFCNKYLISLWLMLSPWIIRTLTLPPLLASLVPCNFRRYLKLTIYRPQNSHHTYLSWHFHSHSEIYCHATSIIIIYMTWAFIVILLCMIVR